MILDCDDRDFDLLEQITGSDWSKQRKKAKKGERRAVRFSTVETLCIAKGCQPGDILRYESDGTTLSDLMVHKDDVEEDEQLCWKPYVFAAVAAVLIVIALVLGVAIRL